MVMCVVQFLSSLVLIFALLVPSLSTAKIGIITCPDKSHTFTFTKVAMELIGAGHEVFFCIRDHDYENATAGPGINYKIIENWFTRTERQQLREHLTTLDIVSAELEDTDWMFKDYNFFLNSSCVHFLKEKQIDLFLFDPLYIANYLVLQQLNVSSLAISTNSLYDPILSYVYGTSNSLSEIPQMSLGRDNKLRLYGRLLNIFTWALDYAYLKYYFYKLERLAFAHNLLPFSDPRSHFGRQILLLPLQTGFDYPRQLATNVMYIGPILNELKPLTDDWEKLLEKKTIVLSFGTTFYHKVLFQAIEGLSSLASALNRNQSQAYAAAQNSRRVKVELAGAESEEASSPPIDYQVLVQCNIPLLSESSKRLFLRLVNELPNVHHYNWIPQLEVLSHRNVVLFVSHGGINGVMESLYHGKPVLGIPLIHDQEENIVRVTSAGAGLQLAKSSSSHDVFNAAGRIITSKSFYESASQVSKFLRYGGPLQGAKAALFWIEYTLNVGSTHLITPLVLSGHSIVTLYHLDILAVVIGLYFLFKLSWNFLFQRRANKAK